MAIHRDFEDFCGDRPPGIHKLHCGKRSVKHKYQNLCLVQLSASCNSVG